jgi:ppGpp synthetase/RelA/SpoT-type nucleotidyltranferase
LWRDETLRRDPGGEGKMPDTTSEQLGPQLASAQAEAQYRALQPKYEKLATEVEYILQDALAEERVPVASVSKRVKSIASFAGKLRRKTYKDPLADVTDLAGVRVVSYFRGDLARLEAIIRRHFHVDDKIDKFADMETDQFGYMAVQFIVCLKESYLGARYDELHGLKCEIQTRPVLADAWAILDHHLVYKKENAIPAELARQMKQLAAIVENAENQFEAIRREIEAHRESAKVATGDAFLNQPINQSSVIAFLERMSPNIPRPDKEITATLICSEIAASQFRTLADIDGAVRRTRKAVLAMRQDVPIYAADQELQYAIAFAHPPMRRVYADWFEALFKKHRHLVDESHESER